MSDVKERPQLSHRAVFEVDADFVVTLRAGDGGAIDEARRDELLADLAAGKHVAVEMDIMPFRQRPGMRNRNAVRFRDGAMRAMGRSGKGMPFLRDHAQGNQLAVGGYITKSVMDQEVVDGAAEWRLHQTVKLTAPWAVEQALRGLIRFFSIGWSPGEILCLACDADYRKCWHWPGDRLEDGTVVEIEYQDAELVETSVVPVPAVIGTGVEAIRAAMAAARAPGLDGGKKDPQSGRMPRFARLATILALTVPPGADLDEDAACAAVELLKKQNTKLELERDAAQQKLATAEKDLGEARQQLGARDATERTAKLDAAIEKAYAEKKLVRTAAADGAAVADPFEAILRRTAEVDSVDAAVAAIGTLRVREGFGPVITGSKDPNPKLELGKTGMTAGQLAAHRQYAIDTGRDPDKYIADLTAEQGA